VFFIDLCPSDAAAGSHLVEMATASEMMFVARAAWLMTVSSTSPLPRRSYDHRLHGSIHGCLPLRYYTLRFDRGLETATSCVHLSVKRLIILSRRRPIAIQFTSGIGRRPRNTRTASCLWPSTIVYEAVSQMMERSTTMARRRVVAKRSRIIYARD